MRTLACWLVLVGSLAKARELDPATCASRFDVQKDKIIRTEESREMGAKYLSELDVGTRHECLRLCCETEACDVFVYEEKIQGSCYLFKCGPPEDFRCKFTSHGNFSSGVLALSRRLAERQDQELAQHERELVNLRLMTTPTTTMSTTTSTTPSPPQHPAEPLHLPTPHPTPRRCSRYQFECRTSGECIAVYNACDGIPQCADGSDEAPELGCPTPPPVPLRTTTRAPVVYKPVLPDQSEMSLNEAPSEGSASSERWPHRLTQAQPQHRFSEPAQSSHIFSHKGGLLQEPDSNAISNGMMGQYPAFEAPWPHRPWVQPAPGMEGVWGGGQWVEPDPRRAWRLPPQPPQQQELPPYQVQKTMPETPTMYSNQHTLRDSPKKGFELMKQLPDPPEKTEAKMEGEKVVTAESMTKKKELKEVPPPTTTAQPTPPTAKPVHEHFASADDHAALSEHPPAAMLLLVLGIIMTICMGGMVGCRARAVRRRLRRGKLAHDADYLVNGMYL